jgi:hypothetical protein
VPELSEQAGAGLLAVRAMLAEWQDLRAELHAIEAAEHPAVTDKFGRVWAWWKGDLYHHDDTLALTPDMIERLTGLPPERLRGNPNYWRLCELCRSRWADTAPVSPRSLITGGWYDVRDGLTYAAQEGAELA